VAPRPSPMAEGSGCERRHEASACYAYEAESIRPSRAPNWAASGVAACQRRRKGEPPFCLAQPARLAAAPVLGPRGLGPGGGTHPHPGCREGENGTRPRASPEAAPARRRTGGSSCWVNKRTSGQQRPHWGLDVAQKGAGRGPRDLGDRQARSRMGARQGTSTSWHGQAASICLQLPRPPGPGRSARIWVGYGLYLDRCLTRARLDRGAGDGTNSPGLPTLCARP